LRRADDPTAELAANPILRSWGRDAREMQLILRAHGVVEGEHRPAAPPPRTLLGMIQADVRADRSPGAVAGAPDAAPPLLEEADDSLQIHSCHGRARQVEVLRDAVLRLLESDPTLEPRDVIVMCPDIEAFVPLITAVFGGVGVPVDSGREGVAEVGGPVTDGLPRLRVRLADRSLRQTNPLLAVTSRILALAAGRMSASDVLDLLAMEAVSRRFGLDGEDLSVVHRWVAACGVRWGLDGPHRSPWHLEAEEANTWRSGLDRLLLGVAMDEEGLRTFEGVLPYGDLSSSTVDLTGRLAELVERLTRIADAFAGRRPVGEWVTELIDATEAIAESAAHERWQHDELRAVLGGVAEEAGVASTSSPGAGLGPELVLAEVAELLEDRLRGRPTRANFRTGDLTVCTMVPMRSVPHRVVALLGLDDGVFPRGSDHDGDNVLLVDPRVGERDAPAEDRQLLLDALLAAGDHLIVTFEGRDLRTNQSRPPSVPVAELLDVVDRTVRLPDDGPARQRVVVEHPLQSFDPRIFTAGALGVPGPFGFDPVNLEAAQALRGPSDDRRIFLSSPLPPLAPNSVDLAALVRFVQHPVQAFLRTRFGLYLTDGEEETLRDDIPIVLDALERWSVGDRLLTQRLGGAPFELVETAERARGSLPPGRLADALLIAVENEVDAIAGVVEALPCWSQRAETCSVRVPLADGRTVAGSVAQVRDGVILHVTFSKLRAKQELAAWVRFVALTAASPERPVSAVTVGRNPAGKVQVSKLEPLDADAGKAAEIALGHLTALVDLWDRGMREPLPLYCATSAAWAAAPSDSDPRGPARQAWYSSDGSTVPGEDADPYHRIVLGGAVPFDDLLVMPPAEDEQGPGWASDERSRFARLARRLWNPVLAHRVPR
jgi:exodeoxyribonuclease V gamma subunit